MSHNISEIGGRALAAEGIAASSTPVLTGGIVRATVPGVALVDGQAARSVASRAGAMVQKPYAVAEAGWSAQLALSTATPVAIQAAAGAGLKRLLVALQAINTGASALDLIVLDGATQVWRLTLPINVPIAVAFPMELIVTANTALNANLSAAGTVLANFQGYTAP